MKKSIKRAFNLLTVINFCCCLRMEKKIYGNVTHEEKGPTTKSKPFLISSKSFHCFAYEMNLFNRLSDSLSSSVVSVRCCCLVVFGYCQYLYSLSHYVSRKEDRLSLPLLLQFEYNGIVSCCECVCVYYIISNYAIKITVWVYSDLPKCLKDTTYILSKFIWEENRRLLCNTAE